MATTRDNAGQYGNYSEDQCTNEILRLLAAIEDHKENKKAEMKAYNDLIKEEEESIKYLRGRIDNLRHEDAVAEVTGE